MTIDRLFVYGTLMPGQTRWPALAPWIVGSPIPDSVVGELFDTGYGWPAIVVRPGEPIAGFTVLLAADSLSAALDALDEIEGTDKGLFQRIPVTTTLGSRAWIYQWASATAQFTKIGSCGAAP
ncbi:hypothetical protein BOO86_10325 [Mycobacterium sp. CBMA 234]|uniref:gamma-glutamylcyclotransferase family protein n=1 Tax=Mycolicibacterium sp. CBMA 234 TaxID=1918495 RepID=UPI0012DEB3AC|nr:gamma-glutamylcyclotransferase family protein [Mycolicibacterium sp. CBMA 234]MUL64857.1 hypothetical protein [Mycolicibacterium sp. CBMA 234]